MGRYLTKKKPSSRRKTSNGFSAAKIIKSSHSWVDKLRFEPLNVTSSDVPRGVDSATSSGSTTTGGTTVSILSWNVLAEAYCSHYSQVQLPVQYQKVVFQPLKRKAVLLKVLRDLCRENYPDVICLQEVDISDIGELLKSLGYVGVETPRVVGGGAGGRTDACAVYVRSSSTPTASADGTPSPLVHTDHNNNNNDDYDNKDKDDNDKRNTPSTQPTPLPQWQLVDHELLRLDDLATLSTTVAAPSTAATVPSTTMTTFPLTSNVQGMQMSLLRRNVAVLVRLRDRVSNQTMVVANAHLYWNPGFEYVKLCQAHYILQRLKSFQSSPDEPVVFCGDLNSRPGGTTHSYLTHGYINAKLVAPWYAMHASKNNSDNDKSVECNVEPSKKTSATVDENLIDNLNGLTLFDGDDANSNKNDMPRMRYLLDAGLNKLCRWLRILGQDAALETEEEEKLRTGKAEMVIFDRCIQECRTLVTTSPRLMQRRDCPSSVYCIHPPFLPKLEVALVHMLLTHGVTLEPATFLSRCVVCNGNIVEEHDDSEKRRILSEYEAPSNLIDDGMAVYECDGCKQGYWWNDLPTSSASRVKTAATRLFELCVRGGVPIRSDTDDDSGLFSHVDVPKLQTKGWDDEIPGGELLHQKLDFVEWLKQDRLKCPFELESAYALKLEHTGGIAPFVGERIPFTNVTHQFVDTLDYIFFDRRRLAPIELLYVPTSFVELCGDRTDMKNAHLLPSHLWPSDHLAVGARLVFRTSGETAHEAKRNGNVAVPGHVIASAKSTTPANLAAYDQTDEAMMYCLPLGSEFPPPPPLVSMLAPAPAFKHTRTSKSAKSTTQANLTASDQTDEAMMYCSPLGSGFSPPPPPVSIVAPAPAVIHKPTGRCGCGCIPPILSLFEMAELRKQAKLEKRRLA